jgi:ribonuclease-3
MDTKALENSIGYTFKDKSLLQTALTHSSYANENRKSKLESNERLEFLGDSVLGFIVASHLFKNEPGMPEGQMTRTRAELVCERTLERAARKLALGDYLRLGRGEDQNGGRRRPSILADAFEALIAAVFLDGGLMPAKKIVTKLILKDLSDKPASFDYKTALQELVQRKSGQTLSYHMTGESGPDHQKEFFVEVRLNGEAKGRGRGRSKKEAEQAAAKAALEAMAP